MKKKIDERIRTLIENCVKLNQRGLIIIVGDRGLYQVSIFCKTNESLCYGIGGEFALNIDSSQNKGSAISLVVL